MNGRLIKHAFHWVGLNIERRDRLVESIPSDYLRSPFLPLVYRGALDKYLYFHDQVQRVQQIDGDIVECGVSIGHGALLFLLLSEYVGKPRLYWGFDSFEGFPDPVEADEHTPITGAGFWASPPEAVLRTLRDGRLPEEVIRERVRLVKGLFDQTLREYQGRIAILHLDCDLYQSYQTALECLYQKVAPGGVIMFDEYNDSRWPGATKAIDNFFRDKPERVQPHAKCSWKYFLVKS
jgi:hypothetical protein